METKKEVMITAYHYIERLYRGIQEDVEILRSMQKRNHSEMTIQIIDGLSWVIEAIHLTQEVQREVIEVIDIKDILSEMLIAFENEDNTLLADMMEYEILPILEKWYQSLGDSIGGNESE